MTFLYTFILYSIAFCSVQELASDVISGVIIGDVCLDVGVKLGDSWLTRSGDIRPGHFLPTMNEQWIS